MALILTRLMTRDRMVPMIMMAAMVTIRSGLSTNREGPGRSPQITIEPIITAITESPGMPRDMVVVSDPPRVALEAVSAAVISDTDPLPNFSECFDLSMTRSQINCLEMSVPSYRS